MDVDIIIQMEIVQKIVTFVALMVCKSIVCIAINYDLHNR